MRLPATGLALGGAELHEVYPFVPLAAGHALGLAACTYGDSVCLGVCAEPHAMPGLADFTDSLSLALDDLDRPVGTKRKQAAGSAQE